MISAKDLMENLNKEVKVKISIGKDWIFIPGKIVDCRIVYGRTDYQLLIQDNQTFWVEASHVQF